MSALSFSCWVFPLTTAVRYNLDLLPSSHSPHPFPLDMIQHLGASQCRTLRQPNRTRHFHSLRPPRHDHRDLPHRMGRHPQQPLLPRNLHIPSLDLVILGYLTYTRRTFNFEGKINAQWSRDLGTEGRLRVQDQHRCCGHFSPFVEATV